MDLNFFGVIDRGIQGTVARHPAAREGGQEARLTAEGNFYGFRAVSNIDYLSSFLFRLAFNDVFTQAVNSEVKSQVFLSKAIKGFSFGGMVERYQNFFQKVDSDGTLSNPPSFDSIRILHTPSADASSVDRPLWHSPFFWSFDASLAGLSRSEPGFHTGRTAGTIRLQPRDFPASAIPRMVRASGANSARDVLHRAVCEWTCRHRSDEPAGLETSVEVRPPVLEKVFDKEFLGRKWKHVIEPRVVYRW